MSGTEELKQLADRLANLMTEPHPGLMTWRIALARTIFNIAQFSGDDAVIKAAEEALDKLKGKGV